MIGLSWLPNGLDDLKLGCAGLSFLNELPSSGLELVTVKVADTTEV